MLFATIRGSVDWNYQRSTALQEPIKLFALSPVTFWAMSLSRRESDHMQHFLISVYKGENHRRQLTGKHLSSHEHSQVAWPASKELGQGGALPLALSAFILQTSLSFWSRSITPPKNDPYIKNSVGMLQAFSDLSDIGNYNIVNERQC